MKIKVSVYINGIRSDHSSLERYRIQSITIDRIVNDIRKRCPDTYP